jgi:hypothetical protein
VLADGQPAGGDAGDARHLPNGSAQAVHGLDGMALRSHCIGLDEKG